jgi:hypothetical protein
MFSPKFAILSAMGISILLVLILLSAQGPKTVVQGSSLAASAGGGSPAVPNAGSPSAPAKGASSAALSGSATLDLGLVAKASTIDDADNVRWSLVRTTGDTNSLYNSKSGVDWKALRQVTRSGSFSLAAGSTWSFNDTFQEGVGYKNASGVLAGGQCSLATVIRGAAIKAGLPNQAKPHRYPVPGFALADTVNIWWGRDDLTIQNPTGQDLAIAWELTPKGVTVTIHN